ncbi:MAG TPA: hypothetical protein VEY89_02265, partial [Candidatus Dormibacteraeota bacterium]|nr:hypothetical protein [Candidatus Dormibacteraeota bacterium]
TNATPSTGASPARHRSRARYRARGSALGTGCATSSRGQNEQWSPQDQRAYREYLGEQHLPYQDLSLLGGEQQNAYLMWRHAHPDAGNSAAGS